VPPDLTQSDARDSRRCLRGRALRTCKIDFHHNNGSGFRTVQVDPGAAAGSVAGRVSSGAHYNVSTSGEAPHVFSRIVYSDLICAKHALTRLGVDTCLQCTCDKDVCQGLDVPAARCIGYRFQLGTYGLART